MAAKLLYSGPKFDAAVAAEQRACLNLVVWIFDFQGGRMEGSGPGTPAPAASFMPPVRDYLDRSRRSFGAPTGDGPFRDSVHAGDDVGWNVPDGTVIAIADGVVRLVTHAYSWGFLVVVEHQLPGRRRYCSLYGHLAPSISVSQGQVVRKGERLGAIGRSHTWENGGYPAHLHFGIHRGPHTQSRPWTDMGSSPAGEGAWLLPTKPDASWVAGYVATDRWREGWHGWVEPQDFIRRHGGRP